MSPDSRRRPRNRRRALGAAGEERVASWYRARGYEVVDRNWRCRDGELDLVLRQGPTVVFCEVKTRSGGAFGLPIEAITHDKRRRLRRLAARWLDEHTAGAAGLRFDVASVQWPTGSEPSIEVVEGAF